MTFIEFFTMLLFLAALWAIKPPSDNEDDNQTKDFIDEWDNRVREKRNERLIRKLLLSKKVK